jgi:hypothetical protein
VKTTGDGLLVEFGSVVDALRCAVEVQREMAGRKTGVSLDNRIEFRIGINMGDIVVEDGDIFGDGVNVAARLEGLAEPGGICVSARVREDTMGRLDLAFEDIGEQRLKNISRLVHVFRVVTGPRPAPEPPLALPDKPSIAVLPFQNMSGDPEQKYFVDGMVEENTSQAPDASNSAVFTSPARCQVDPLMDCFGLAVNRRLQLLFIFVGAYRYAALGRRRVFSKPSSSMGWRCKCA